MIIYISGPYTYPDPVTNFRRSLEFAETLLKAGHTPILPHLSLFWDLIHHHPWEEWIAYDLRLIAVCDALLRIPGASKGADMEVEEAKRLGIPFLTMNEILRSGRE